MVRATIVPDHDVAFAPLMAVFGAGLDPVALELLDERVALGLRKAFDVEKLVQIEVERLASRLRMRAYERVEGWRLVSVCLVEQAMPLLAAAVHVGASQSFDPVPELAGQRIVGRVRA